MELATKSLSISYGKETFISLSDTSFYEGVTFLLGPNGSGKTTILKAIRLLIKFKGGLFFNDQPITSQFALENISYLPQHHATNINLSVTEVVLLGVYYKLGLKNNDKLVHDVHKLLRTLNILELADRELNTLSGGERKLVYLAQVLLKQPKILLLDEPCNFLDIKKQLVFYKYIASLKNMTVIVAEHNINYASRYGKRIILMKEGSDFWSGDSTQLCSKTINKVYEVNCVSFHIDKTKQFFFDSNEP